MLDKWIMPTSTHISDFSTLSPCHTMLLIYSHLIISSIVIKFHQLSLHLMCCACPAAKIRLINFHINDSIVPNVAQANFMSIWICVNSFEWDVRATRHGSASNIRLVWLRLLWLHIACQMALFQIQMRPSNISDISIKATSLCSPSSLL